MNAYVKFKLDYSLEIDGIFYDIKASGTYDVEAAYYEGNIEIDDYGDVDLDEIEIEYEGSDGITTVEHDCAIYQRICEDAESRAINYEGDVQWRG